MAAMSRHQTLATATRARRHSRLTAPRACRAARAARTRARRVGPAAIDAPVPSDRDSPPARARSTVRRHTPRPPSIAASPAATSADVGTAPGRWASRRRLEPVAPERARERRRARAASRPASANRSNSENAGERNAFGEWRRGVAPTHALRRWTPGRPTMRTSPRLAAGLGHAPRRRTTATRPNVTRSPECRARAAWPTAPTLTRSAHADDALGVGSRQRLASARTFASRSARS